jgi:YD repeat-containing protein
MIGKFSISSARSRPPRVTAIREDVSGTLDPSITVNRGDVLRETRSYTQSGLLAGQTSYRTPGAGDTLVYAFDGFDRLARITHPAVAPDPSRFEDFGYEQNGNRTLHRTRAGQDIVLGYDALNRLSSRAVPANANAPAVDYTWSYDLAGRVLRLRQNTDPADVIYAYDTAGRLTGETRPDGRAIGYGRDADGNVTGLVWPLEAGDPYEATYARDALGRVSGVFEGAGTAGFRIAGYGYDTASRRLSLLRGNANMRTYWGWRPDGRVATLTHSFAGGSPLPVAHLYNSRGGASARLLNAAASRCAATPGYDDDAEAREVAE